MTGRDSSAPISPQAVKLASALRAAGAEEAAFPTKWGAGLPFSRQRGVRGCWPAYTPDGTWAGL